MVNFFNTLSIKLGIHTMLQSGKCPGKGKIEVLTIYQMTQSCYQSLSFAEFGQFCNQFAFGWMHVFDEKYHVVECLARSAQQAHYHLHTTIAVAFTLHQRIQSLLFRGHHIGGSEVFAKIVKGESRKSKLA